MNIKLGKAIITFFYLIIIGCMIYSGYNFTFNSEMAKECDAIFLNDSEILSVPATEMYYPKECVDNAILKFNVIMNKDYVINETCIQDNYYEFTHYNSQCGDFGIMYFVLLAHFMGFAVITILYALTMGAIQSDE